MTKSALLTIGTTPVNLLSVLRGITAGIASQNFGPLLNDQCRALQMKCDNGTVYRGDNANVSSTNYGLKMQNGEGAFVSDAHVDSLNLSDYWLVGAGAGTLVSVEITTI